MPLTKPGSRLQLGQAPQMTRVKVGNKGRSPQTTNEQGVIHVGITK